MCVYGYVRVSTLKQKVERQIANIKKEYPNAVIIDESYTCLLYTSFAMFHHIQNFSN